MDILKAFRLEQSLVKKLSDLARKTHRTETFYVEEALRSYLEEYRDAQIAKDRLNDPNSKIISDREMRRRLGV